jgi:hypothetical protein
VNKSFLEIVLIFIFASAACQAQTNPNLENGIKPFGSYDGADIDQVNLQTGGLSVRIPLFSYPQRGDQKITVALMLGSKGWVNEERHCLGSPNLTPILVRDNGTRSAAHQA